MIEKFFEEDKQQKKSTLTTDIIRKKILGTLLGGAIGDALGVPSEFMSIDKIKAKFGKISGYEKSINSIFMSRYGINENISGLRSDDTALTFAIIRSILEKGKIDFENIGQYHLQTLDNYPYGMGSSTQNAIEKIRQGISIFESGTPNGGGNGVIMKQSPLAIYYQSRNCSESEIIHSLSTITKMTHNFELTVLATIIHNKLLMELNNTEGEIDKIGLLKTLINYTKFYESQMNIGEFKISQLLEKIISFLDPQTGELKLTDQEILQNFGRGTNHIRYSGFVYTTVGIVYTLFFRNPNFQGLLDAVNIGGDTDTYAAIIGNMIGAYRGVFFDDNYVEGLQQKEQLINLTNSFVDFLI